MNKTKNSTEPLNISKNSYEKEKKAIFCNEKIKPIIFNNKTNTSIKNANSFLKCLYPLSSKRIKSDEIIKP